MQRRRLPYPEEADHRRAGSAAIPTGGTRGLPAMRPARYPATTAPATAEILHRGRYHARGVADDAAGEHSHDDRLRQPTHDLRAGAGNPERDERHPGGEAGADELGALNCPPTAQAARGPESSR